MTLRRLTPDDVASYRRLRLRGLQEAPSAFGSSYQEEVERPMDMFVRRLEPADDSRVFGVFDGERLVGTVTLLRDAQRKMRHKAAIYGLYVDRSARGMGWGRALMTEAIEAGRRMRGVRQIRLAVTATNRAALQLYRSLGFEVYGEERNALFVGGRFYSELLLVLPLRVGARKPVAGK